MGTLGKGRSTGSNAQYDISNLHFYRDGEDIGIAEFFGVDSSSIDKASTHWHMGILCQGGRSDHYRNADDYADWRYVDRQHEIRR